MSSSTVRRALAAAFLATSAAVIAPKVMMVLDGLVGWLRRPVATDDPTVGLAAVARVEEAP